MTAGAPRLDGASAETVEVAIARALPALRTSASAPDRIAYARDLWPRHHLETRAGRVAEHRPALVAWPKDTAEVAAVVNFCAREGVPLVQFGAGSGVCGGVLPEPRAIVLDVKRLAGWSIDAAAGPTLRVGAGAMGVRLEEDLAAKGYTLGHFPSSILCSTVGGWVAARSAGQCSGLYGKMEDMVAALEVVTGSGEIVELSRRVHGPDLTPLVIGSEGVLGVVTAATLRLHPAPDARAFGAFTFRGVEAGWEAMREMFQAGLRPAVARLYDPFDTLIARLGRRHGVRADAAKKGPRAPGAGGAALRTLLRAPRVLNEAIDAVGAHVWRGAQLVLIFEGASKHPAEDLARATEIAARRGAKDLGEGPARHWLSHRYAVSYRQAPVFMAGAFSDTMEVAATWTRLPELYAAVRAAIGERAFVMAHLSHAYPDGCSIYFTFAGAAETPDEGLARYDAIWRDALDAAIGAGGTLSHHHGVGRSKAPKLGDELGRAVDLVNAVRAELDPAGILNPGNLLPRGPRRAPPPAPAAPDLPVVDEVTGIVSARGAATLGEIEAAVAEHGLTLELGAGAPALDTPIAAWLAHGARGAPDPWLDPVDHLVVGFAARLASGAEVVVRPCPRRAVGPDVFALFLGADERVGVVTSAMLRARSQAHRPRALSTSLDRNPPMNEGEARLVDRVLTAASRVGPAQ
jgi:alkyldihydroxyacetonephosphate synthase